MQYKYGIITNLLIIGFMVLTQVAHASITVNTNVSSVKAIKKLNDTQKRLDSTFKKLSQARRNSSDDATGLGVSELLQARLKNLDKSREEVSDAISVIQTAEKVSNEVANILKRMRELAVQSASETLSEDEREYILDEFSQLSEEVSRIDPVTSFNGISFDTENDGNESVTRKAGKLFFQNLDEIRGEFQEIKLTEEDDPSYRSDLLESLDEAIKEISATQRDVEKTSKKILKDAEKRVSEAEKELARSVLNKKTKKLKQQQCGTKGQPPCKLIKK